MIMPQKRVFKTKTFNRWASKLLSDAVLCAAAREIELGRFDADLGGGVCKKRVVLAGQGKSGSTRILIAKRHEAALFFLAGRSKSDPGTDFSVREEEAAKLLAAMLQVAPVATLDQMSNDGFLKEICHAQECSEK